MLRINNAVTTRRIAATLFFGGLLLLGLLLTPNYGMGWDEPTDREAGYISLRYVAQVLHPAALDHSYFTGLPELRTYKEADHGVAFQLPLAVLEATFFPHDIQRAYWMRHFLCFATFVLGAWAVYRMGARRFGSWRWGLVGAAMLMLSPRIFAEAFYNHKDVVFMNLFALGGLTLLRLLRRPTAGRAAVHALVTALAVDVRVMGLLLPALTVAFGALEWWARPVRRQALARSIAVYAAATGPLVVLFWPYLWEAPVARLWESFGNFRRFRQTMQVFYLGQMESCQRLPWHYLPVWLLVTTPVVYSLLFLGGAGAVLRGFFRGPLAFLQRTAGRHDLLFGAWCVGPLVLIVAIQSVVYDGWRHVYFIYPAFVLLAVRGLKAGVAAYRAARPGSAGRRVGQVAGVLLAAGVAHTAVRQVADHPHQYAYFSFLPGPVAGQLFERDYWGISARQGLTWVLAHDPRATVAISDTLYYRDFLGNNSQLLPAADRARIRLVPHYRAAYFIGMYRWHPADYDASYGTAVHEIRVAGLPILTVFRR
ncbi:hypothetical protein [Hymenobacter glacialis]|uniref:Glycosyltransferase RgtA/B/C/D-like domain-containing protein n=1 Tax=Hymenobacter glacialis TaxID=1908236 RepID=A0A1G1SWC3_9BACT|nr:hypothetical protein [Hymenobacter glacialis]OGX82926.1 hypothetical protein BEN48_03950 [Hymenobacter glacialis]